MVSQVAAASSPPPVTVSDCCIYIYNPHTLTLSTKHLRMEHICVKENLSHIEFVVHYGTCSEDESTQSVFIS